MPITAHVAPPPVSLIVATPAAPARAATSRRKRAFDIAVAALALFAFLPLLVLIGAAVWMESDGPILFRQQRTGLNGKPFRIYKFRTMTVMEDGDGVRQAVRGDARVTPLGGLLRKLSLDELPQLLNVLKGEMSIVGPRPHALSHDVTWSRRVPGYADRFRVRPGLTGQAQVMGYRGEVANDEGLIQRIGADNAYIDGWSFTRDLALVARTVPLLFGDAQAF
ncbi:sugar transferase [Phenylobacterium sp.]|uniref:sugar transferase n=1 Tax=Phenylobacterium sp. TaxID=1871053 RepID=UPI0025E1D885|nr:sugar transferase [Phenylobacterium sp.]MBX3483428.1 sugar transferase [Phenylobacterium sp.]MCW5761170.1 sugar transferase [Phenylobacterium sp.]